MSMQNNDPVAPQEEVTLIDVLCKWDWLSNPGFRFKHDKAGIAHDATWRGTARLDAQGRHDCGDASNQGDRANGADRCARCTVGAGSGTPWRPRGQREKNNGVKESGDPGADRHASEASTRRSSR